MSTAAHRRPNATSGIRAKTLRSRRESVFVPAGIGEHQIHVRYEALGPYSKISYQLEAGRYLCHELQSHPGSTAPLREHDYAAIITPYETTINNGHVRGRFKTMESNLLSQS